MAILRRFWTVVKSNLNHLVGKAEDPEKMLNQMLLDMQEQLIEAKKQVAMSIADEKRLAKQYSQENDLTKEWEKKAMLAVKAGNDQLATQALERKADHAKQAQGFNQQWQAQKTSVEALKKALRTLSDKINDAKRKKNLLVARAKRAEAQKTISETMSGLSTTSASETISRMEEKIDRMEAEAQATTEMANEIGVDELEAQFEELEVIEANDALTELKAKMGIEAAPSAEMPIEKADDREELKKIEEEIKAETSARR